MREKQSKYLFILDVSMYVLLLDGLNDTDSIEIKHKQVATKISL